MLNLNTLRAEVPENALVGSTIETLEVVNIKEGETIVCSFVADSNPDGRCGITLLSTQYPLGMSSKQLIGYLFQVTLLWLM